MKREQQNTRNLKNDLRRKKKEDERKELVVIMIITNSSRTEGYEFNAIKGYYITMIEFLFL
jgi:Mg-chelatase subunit ChlD